MKTKFDLEKKKRTKTNVIDLRKKSSSKKTDVKNYGDAARLYESSLKVFLVVMGIAYLSVFIYNHVVS